MYNTSNEQVNHQHNEISKAENLKKKRGEEMNGMDHYKGDKAKHYT